MSKEKRITTHSPDETISLGYEYAKNLKVKDVIGLFGNPGSGKTQFVKGICTYFNIQESVTSPTFIIVNEYRGTDSGKQININHFDLYRVKNIHELKEIGINSYVTEESICVIEWAGIADEYFKGNLRKVFFEHGENENERIILSN